MNDYEFSKAQNTGELGLFLVLGNEAVEATSATCQCTHLLSRIDDLTTKRFGVGEAPNLDSLKQMLDRISEIVKDSTGEESEAATSPGPTGTPNAKNSPTLHSMSGPLQGREHAMKALIDVCATSGVMSQPVPSR